MTLRVLIVDDEAPIRRLLQNWVEADGGSVLQAGTAEQGLDLVRAEGAPAAALCDMRLPGRDGLWLAEQLRTDYPETAVVMTTAVNEIDVIVTSMQVGVVDYLVKPFTHERMMEALRRAFFAHQSRRALASTQQELEARRTQIAEAMAELEVNAMSSLEVMIEIVHARDPAASQHAHRVARVAVNLAMTLRIGEPQLSDIERAALLHNIGRLALPDDLLQRDDVDLTHDERARVRAYPLRGRAILHHAPFLAAASEIAIATHERYDGSGFPYGLTGDAIPLGARIIGLANAYDELTSGIGRRAVTPVRAIEILSTERAPEFDPLVLGALKMLQPSGHAGL
jgi:response regulator RpfG family c-di-GMP phosphodiesterase